ncbi:MAG: hypothetical protein IJO20_05700 [Ruminococcus sp.]|nr:hypothetical protein [Ruminococcus sp.]MBQ7133973.1 hypothetical protein [Ruminococcus sp.]
MLNFIFTDIYDEEHSVYPVSVTVNMDENVPADDLFATFHHFTSSQLKSLSVYDENGVLFTGIVDEQTTQSNSDGEYLKISARSMAALLLDNESVPISYNSPSVRVIEERHLKPFGVKVSESLSDTYFGTHTVLKGESNYKAVDSFANKLYSNSVRVDEKGELSFLGAKKNKSVVFSNSFDGISYYDFCENIKRCEEISKVRIKLSNSSGYHSVVENQDAIKRGVVRERYLNCVLTDTPASYAQSMINNGSKKSYSVTLYCEGQHLNVFGCNATIKGSVCGDIENLYVSSIRYALSDKKEVTVITLKRKEV